jgi:Cdc6-like AAA superfamily ATPase
MNLKISIGKALNSEKEVFLDLQKDNVHTIVFSGSTGSGKSTFHHEITKQLIKNNTPKEVGFVFIDFKQVEFSEYKNSDYLYHSIIYKPEEAAVVLKDLIHESELRFKGSKSSEKTIVVNIEESDILYSFPTLLEEVWQAIKEQSEKNNIYVLFSSSKCSNEVFTAKILDSSSLKGVFISPHSDAIEINKYTSLLFGKSSKILPEPWTRIFQLRDGEEIAYKGYL